MLPERHSTSIDFPRKKNNFQLEIMFLRADGVAVTDSVTA